MQISLKKKMIVGAMFAMLSTGVLAKGQIDFDSPYADKPMVFGNQVFKQVEINTLFEAAYNLKNNKEAHVIDVVKVDEKYAALFLKEENQIRIVFTDGEQFFSGAESNVPLITPELETKLLDAYRAIQFNEKLKSPGLLEKIKVSAKADDKEAQSSLALMPTIKPSKEENALDEFFYENLKTLTPVFLGEVKAENPDAIVFVSSHCGYCKKLLGEYKANPDAYRGINLAFIPVGNPEMIKTGEWDSFFGGKAEQITPESLLRNNDFFAKAVQMNNENGFATPSYMWKSKEKGGIIKLNGLIEAKNMDRVKADAQSLSETDSKS
jgi:thiol-disulfide isomerase/thioredoxin